MDCRGCQPLRCQVCCRPGSGRSVTTRISSEPLYQCDLAPPAGVVAWKGLGLDRPFPRLLQAILMLLGMPRAVKRLMQRTATAASAFWRSKAARAEARADEGLVAEHRGFGEGAAVVAGLGLPGVAADLGDAGDRRAAGGRRVLASRRRADRRALARRDHRLRAAREDGGMAVEAVVGLVGADRGDRRFDGGEQAFELAAVVDLARGQGVGVQHRRSGCPRPGAACARPGACPCRARGPSTRPRHAP